MEERFPHTAVQCLTAIAQHHGLQVNPERLIHDYALGAEEPSLALFLRMAGDLGLKTGGGFTGMDPAHAKEIVRYRNRAYAMLQKLKDELGPVPGTTDQEQPAPPDPA